MRTLPKPPSKVGGFASASGPSERKITSGISYHFPTDFPECSRDQVKTEEISAALEFNEQIDAARSARELAALRRACVIRVVDAFYLEAVNLKWGAHRTDQQLADFVLSAQAWAELPVRSDIRESEEWKKHLVRRVRQPDRSVEAPQGAATPTVPPTSSDGRLEPYSEEWLGSATADQLQAALTEETKARNALGKGSLPDAAVRERSKQFEIKIVQLKSALNRVEKKDFWETVLAGCSLESRIAGDGHPAAEHANVRFYDWLPDLQQERTERLDKLATENLSPLGRASRTIAITEEFLVREAKEWIAIYKKAAEEFKSPEILLPPWINRFRCAIMSYVGYGLLSAKDTIEISLRTNGETSNPPGFGVYKIVARHILTTVNSKLRVLETGALARPATPGNIWGERRTSRRHHGGRCLRRM